MNWLAGELSEPATEDFHFCRHVVLIGQHPGPAVEDAKWQIELAVAEALSKLGASSEEVRQIIEPHLNDPRAHVRRYARKLL